MCGEALVCIVAAIGVSVLVVVEVVSIVVISSPNNMLTVSGERQKGQNT
jgi:hypothetical protein